MVFCNAERSRFSAFRTLANCEVDSGGIYFKPPNRNKLLDTIEDMLKRKNVSDEIQSIKNKGGRDL